MTVQQKESTANVLNAIKAWILPLSAGLCVFFLQEIYSDLKKISRQQNDFMVEFARSKTQIEHLIDQNKDLKIELKELKKDK